jgi:hypothetical protein
MEAAITRPTGYRFMHPAIFIRVIIWCFSFIKIIPNKIDGFTSDKSVVGVATCYGLDDPEIESWWRRDFPHVQTGPVPTQLHLQWVPGLSRG